MIIIMMTIAIRIMMTSRSGWNWTGQGASIGGAGGAALGGLLGGGLNGALIGGAPPSKHAILLEGFHVNRVR